MTKTKKALKKRATPLSLFSILNTFKCKKSYTKLHKEELERVIDRLIDTLAIDNKELRELNVEDYKDNVIIVDTLFTAHYRIIHRDNSPFADINNGPYQMNKYVPDYIVVYPTDKVDKPNDYITLHDLHDFILSPPYTTYKAMNINDVDSFYALLYVKQLFNIHESNTVLLSKENTTDYDNYFDIFMEVRNTIKENRKRLNEEVFKYKFIAYYVYNTSE